MIQLKSLATVSYSHSTATTAKSLAVSTQYTNVTDTQHAAIACRHWPHLCMASSGENEIKIVITRSNTQYIRAKTAVNMSIVYCNNEPNGLQTFWYMYMPSTVHRRDRVIQAICKTFHHVLPTISSVHSMYILRFLQINTILYQQHETYMNYIKLI